jgi:hypothetical protein
VGMANKILQAEVLEVHSGDDLVVLADLGVDSLYKRVRVRLYGVDTPDAYKAAADTEAGQIRDKVARRVKGKKCAMEVHSQGKASWVVTLFVGVKADAYSLNNILIEEGYVFSQD